LHQCFEIGDVTMSTKTRSGQALDPGGHIVPCMQHPLALGEGIERVRLL